MVSYDDYKYEKYLVRDNGDILRLPKEEKKPRPNDNKWAFGKKDFNKDYAIFCSQAVHRIVATAFLGKSMINH